MRRWWRGACFALLLHGGTLPVGTTYFVSPTGNNANNGTSSATPWQTVGKVNGFSFQPIDTVEFQGGQSFTGCLSFTAAPKLITSYGAGSFTLTANCSGTQASPAAAVTLTTSNITLQNCILVGNGGGGNSGAQYGVWISNPGSVGISTITVQNCDISGFYSVETGGVGSEVFASAYNSSGTISGLKVLNNTLHGSVASSLDDNGIWSATTSSCCGTNQPQYILNVTYSGNTVYDIGAHTAGYLGGNCCTGFGVVAIGVNGGTISNNLVHDIGYNVSHCGGTVGIMAVFANNITIKQNEAYNVQPGVTFGCDSHGFDLDDTVTNSVMEYNYSHNNYGSGYYLCAFHTGGTWGPNTIRYNISENDNASLTGTYGAVTIGCDTPTSFITNIYNNTFWMGRAGLFPIFLGTLPTGGIIANNIFATTKRVSDSAVLYINSVVGNAASFKSNDWYAITGGNNLWSNNQGTLAGWQGVVTGADTNATTANPSLTSPGSSGTCGTIPPQPCPSGYTLQVGSPALSVGTDLTQSPFNLSVGATDYFLNAIPTGVGTGYNIGAY